MIKFFRQSYIVQYIVLAFMALALWIPSFVAGQAAVDFTSPVTPLYNSINRLLGFSSFAKLTFAFILMVFETLFFNSILVGNQIINKVSTMGAFVFLLMMNLTMSQTIFSPFALATVFVLMLLHSIFLIYQTQKPELYLFNSGVFLALATMCYFHSILLVLWLIIALSMAKKGSLRLQLIPALGFIAIYFFYFVGLFFWGDLPTVWHGYVAYFSNFHLTVAGINLKSIIVIVSLILLAVVFLTSSGNSNFEKAIAVRVKISMTFVLAAFALFMLFLGGGMTSNGLIFIVMSIIISYELSYIGNTGWSDLVLAAFLLLVFANKFYFQII